MKRCLPILFVAACTGSTSPPAGAAADAPGPTDSLYLTAENVGGHCRVTIDDQEPFTSAEETLADYEPGQTIQLTASAMPGYTLGLWHHTVHDTGSGDPGTISGAGSAAESATSVTLGDTPGCVWICCGSGSDDCPTTDPCSSS